jgi:hypothetical protein
MRSKGTSIDAQVRGTLVSGEEARARLQHRGPDQRVINGPADGPRRTPRSSNWRCPSTESTTTGPGIARSSSAAAFTGTRGRFRVRKAYVSSNT